MARFAFEELGLHRLLISIVPRNQASRRVVEKLGIRCEGMAVALPADQRRVGGPHAVRRDRGGLGAAGPRARCAPLGAFSRAAVQPCNGVPRSEATLARRVRKLSRVQPAW